MTYTATVVRTAYYIVSARLEERVKGILPVATFVLFSLLARMNVSLSFRRFLVGIDCWPKVGESKTKKK